MNTYTDIKTEYTTFLSFLQSHLPDADLEESLFSYYAAAVLKMWGCNILYSSDYALVKKVYPAFIPLEEDQLVPGTELRLYRDTDNEHDKWAVSVYTMDDQELGYITRFKNETIARLMDEGRVFHAFVDEQPVPPANEDEARRTITPTEDYRLPFSVYMEE